ncbi:MAG: DUF995 domain-containing protein [Gammaproteobacteria bacterium]
MKKLILATAILLSFSTVSMANSLQSLDKSKVKSLLDNKTITTISLTTLNGKTQDNVFTGYFSKDGKTNGSFASAPENQPQTDEGTWKVNDDGQLCMTWQHWNHAKEFCMSLYKTKNSIIFINQHDKLESVVMLDKIKSGNKM